MSKPNSVTCEKQKCEPACTPVQSDQRHCYSYSRKYNSSTCYMQSLNILASLCS